MFVYQRLLVLWLLERMSYVFDCLKDIINIDYVCFNRNFKKREKTCNFICDRVFVRVCEHTCRFTCFQTNDKNLRAASLVFQQSLAAKILSLAFVLYLFVITFLIFKKFLERSKYRIDSHKTSLNAKTKSWDSFFDNYIFVSEGKDSVFKLCF